MRKVRAFFIATAIVAAAIAAAAFSGEGTTALKTFSDYRNTVYAEARAGGGRLTPELTAKIKAKAEELIKDVKPAEVTGADATAYAQVFQAAGKNAEAATLAKSGLKTAANPAEKNDAAFILVGLGGSTDQKDLIFDGLNSIAPANKIEATRFASFVGGYGSYLAGTYKPSQVLPLFDKASAALKEGDFTTDAEKRTYTSLKGALVVGKIEFFKDSGDKAGAVAAANDALKTADATTARRINSVKTQIELPGAPAPLIATERGYGEFAGLESLKGKVVILDFFAHWCGPCIAAFPDMRQLLSEKKGDGLEIVGVTTYYGYYKAERNLTPDQEFAKMDEFIKEQNITWPVVYGPRENFEKYGVSGTPHVTVLDRKGNVHKIEIGYSKEIFAKFRKEVEALLKD